MSYQVIARKWRPQTFEDVIGQDAITQTLRNAIEFDRLHHAYLFSGARGVGKTTTARLLAKALNCHKTDFPNPKPCDSADADPCVSCTEVAESKSLDVLEFDAASHTKVDEIREIILESVNVNPARDRFKIFIIDEVHMLSTSSFNALLKTLEEPPPNVVFIMATTELHKVPDTILSRCQQFDFRTISLQKILSRLKEISKAEKIEISDGALREIARSGEGSMRDAQSNLDQVISFSEGKIETDAVVDALGIASAENLSRTITAIAEKNPGAALSVVDDLVERGQDLRNFCRDLLTFVRDLLIVKIAGEDDELLESAILSPDQLNQISTPFLDTDLIRFFNSIAETESKIREATEPRYLLEIGLIKLIEMRKITPVEQLLDRLIKIEKALEGSSNIAEDLKESEPQTEEKKTLAPEVKVKKESSALGSNPPQTENELPKSQLPEKEESQPEKDFAALIKEKRKNDARIEKKGAIRIDPDSMPVKLEPISAEELEHVEDKRLDREFELRLQREGDNLRVPKDPDELVSALFDRPEASKPSEQIVETNGSAAAAAPKRTRNRALEIVSEITEADEIEESVPILPENPGKEEIRDYAKNHPIVKKVKRVFKGKLKRLDIDGEVIELDD